MTNQNGWISCDTLLPSHGQEVIVCIKTPFIKQYVALSTFYLTGCGKLWTIEQGGLSFFRTVTHWMEKPQPPKESELKA